MWIECTVTSLNTDRLDEELRATLGATYLGARAAGPLRPVLVELIDAATQANRDSAQAVCSAHNGNLLSAAEQKKASDALNLSDAQTRWAASALHNKTPQQIYTAMQGQIDGWTSLANAKADLRTWLPLLFAGIAWTQFKDQQRD